MWKNAFVGIYQLLNSCDTSEVYNFYLEAATMITFPWHKNPSYASVQNFVKWIYQLENKEILLEI